MNSTAKTLIERYEDLLNWEDDQVLENRPISIRLPSEDVALAQALADYYHQSRAGFLQEAVSQLLHDLFFSSSFSKDVRQKVADAAQEFYVRDMKKAYEEKGYSPDQRFISKWFLNRDWPFSPEELVQRLSSSPEEQPE